MGTEIQMVSYDMKKPAFLVITTLSLVLIFLLNQSTSAVESERDLGASKPRNIAKVIKPPDVSKSDTRKVRKITVLITSTSPLFGQTAEDYLAVKLQDAGFDVVEGTKISEATIAELNRVEKQEGKQPEEILDVIKIGEKLGLDAVFVGTLFEGRRQMSFPEEKPPQVMDKMVVSTFYLQAVDVRTRKVMLSLILEYDRGEDIPNAIDAAVKIIKEEMKD